MFRVIGLYRFVPQISNRFSCANPICTKVNEGEHLGEGPGNLRMYGSWPKSEYVAQKMVANMICEVSSVTSRALQCSNADSL